MAKPIIDVSEHNGTLDWDTIKPQIDGAILRCGYGGNLASQDDKQYARNASECTRLQIPFGVYLFSYAVNEAQAQDEADHVLRLVKGWRLSLPIYYDLEYSANVGDLSADAYTRIATAFCERIEQAGGFVGIYANLYYWQTKLYNVTSYTRWLAQWASEPTYDESFKLWQYSSDGMIAGSSERTDVNKWYDNFLTMAGTKNHFDGDVTPPVIEPSDPTLKYHVGDHVFFRALYTSSMSTQPITNIAVTQGTITKVILGAHNPYLINNGTGWVNDDVITTQGTPSPVLKYHVGDFVKFDALYTSSTSTQPITNIAIHQGTITQVIPNAANPYLINGSTGWVNDRVIINSSSTPTIYAIGDLVRVKQGATDYNGTSLAPFVYETVFQVMQVNGNRIVIGNGTQVTAAINARNLYKV